MSEAGKNTRVRGLDYRGPDINRADGIPTPGKNTLVPSGKGGLTGNAYIDGRGHCQTRPDAPGCTLTPSGRALLVDGYQKVVMQAQLQFGLALSDLRVDRLLTKDEDPAPLLGLFIDVMATAALGAIGSVLGMLRSNPKAAAHGLGLGVSDFEVSAGGALTGGGEVDSLTFGNFMDTSQDAIWWIVKSSVDVGKKALKGGPVASDEKAMALGYIETLQNASAIAWQRQVLDPPGYATDDDLAVMFHAFQANAGFTAPILKQKLSDKVDRYTASSAARIGRHQMRTQKDIELQGNTVRDTKVAWVASPSGTPVLYYLKQDAANSQSSNTLANQDVQMLQLHDASFVLDRPVEKEFVDVAIAKHRDVWGAAPETVSRSEAANPLDPSTWVPEAT